MWYFVISLGQQYTYSYIIPIFDNDEKLTFITGGHMAIKDISRVGSRGVIFTFEDDISVYLIKADNNWFLCDTHLGPKSMEHIKNYISEESDQKPVIVFNSHSDWDHIWGNCAFSGGIIIGHDACRTRMKEIGQYELTKLTSYHKGTIKLVLPNLTFNDRMTFDEDGLEFIHAPGHTIDSAICFDYRDSVLFVGDLVEDPIPYLDFSDLRGYIKTLTFIKEFPAKVKISAHSGIVDNALIERNIAYIMDVCSGYLVDPGFFRECPEVHTFNINNRLFLMYENAVRDQLKDNFDYSQFRSNFGDLKKVKYVQLQDELEAYLAHIRP
jgi:glyoxylase-like metal-dependent hydrolase (beta-lactamase superfamily II)